MLPLPSSRQQHGLNLLAKCIDKPSGTAEPALSVAPADRFCMLWKLQQAKRLLLTLDGKERTTVCGTGYYAIELVVVYYSLLQRRHRAFQRIQNKPSRKIGVC